MVLLSSNTGSALSLEIAPRFSVFTIKKPSPQNLLPGEILRIRFPNPFHFSHAQTPLPIDIYGSVISVSEVHGDDLALKLQILDVSEDFFAFRSTLVSQPSLRIQGSLPPQIWVAKLSLKYNGYPLVLGDTASFKIANEGAQVMGEITEMDRHQVIIRSSQTYLLRHFAPIPVEPRSEILVLVDDLEEFSLRQSVPGMEILDILEPLPDGSAINFASPVHNEDPLMRQDPRKFALALSARMNQQRPPNGLHRPRATPPRLTQAQAQYLGLAETCLKALMDIRP